MDYKTYLDFVLAIENRKEPPSLQYMFRLLDVQNKGFLNIFDLNYFFRVIIALFIVLVFGDLYVTMMKLEFKSLKYFVIPSEIYDFT